MGWQRRCTLVSVLLMAVGLIAFAGPAHAQGKPYAGTTLRFIVAHHPWTEAIKPLLKDLEGRTGIRVNAEAYGEDQLRDKLTDKSKGKFGFVARGQRSPAVSQFASFLYSFGGDWFDPPTPRATLDTPEAIAALTF